MEFENIGPEGSEELSAYAYDIMEEYFTTFLPKDLVVKVFERFMLPNSIIKEISEGFRFMYILVDGDRVGFTAIQPQGDDVLLSKIYIQKDQRGKGLGTEAMRQLKDISRELGAKRLYLYVNRNNIPSIKMYEKNGFTIEKNADTDLGDGLVMNDYIMECRL